MESSLILTEDNLAKLNFEGMDMIGRPEKVYLRGKLTAENGEFVGEVGQGRYIKAEPFGLCYDEYRE